MPNQLFLWRENDRVILEGNTFLQNLRLSTTEGFNKYFPTYWFIGYFLYFCIGQNFLWGQAIEVEVETTVQRLLQEEDTDHDQKITVDDVYIPQTQQGDRHFFIQTRDSKIVPVQTTYHLANLLQELTIQKELGQQYAKISMDKILENPVQRISRMIREYYWNGLTRRIDQTNIVQALEDSKIHNTDTRYLYVSHRDEFAYDYFTKISNHLPNLNLKVLRLPPILTKQVIQNLHGKHGLLPLALQKNDSGEIEGVPFVVPGGRFNEMYGWDSYFESLGLIEDGKVRLAQAMVDNFVYQIQHYGKILNANRSYYLTRSQPPFLTSMALAVYQKLPQNQESQQWLKTVLAACIQEYKTVWMNEHHLTPIGLSRYYGTGVGIPPEVEPGHFKNILEPFAKKYDCTLTEFEELYKQGTIQEPILDEFFIHDQAVRESGHDTTYRWRIEGKDSCADFVTVDLNTLLYQYELDIAYMLQTIFNETIPNESSQTWYERAEKRKKLILQYLWNPEEMMFFDYHLPSQKQFPYISATTLYPLWPCHPDRPTTRILSEEEAKQLISKALSYLESNGGILSSAKISLEKFGIPGAERQWDYPNGWAPHQMIIWRGLHHYKHKNIANRLIYKWLYTITKNAVDYNGTIPEKFDVVRRSHAVFAEYGNVGTKFSYMTKEGFGWMNASYQVGLQLLSPSWRKHLENIIPPEHLPME